MSDQFREPPTDATLVRLITGECNAAERRDIQRWVEADSSHRARFDELKAIWTARATPAHWAVEGMWARVRDRISGDARGSQVALVKSIPRKRLESPARQTRPRGDSSWRIASAAAIVLVIGGGIMLAPDRRAREDAEPRAPMREYITARGEKATLELADGSRVILAPESHVRVPVAFDNAARDFYLDGEAIFEVKHHSSSPFRVHVKGAVVEDIGTQFDVRAYASDPTIAVAMAEGSVTLTRANAAGESRAVQNSVGMMLRRGQLGRLDRAGHVTVTSGVSLDPYLAWADGRLTFVDAELSDVLQRISRWHDLDIRVTDPRLAKRRVTAEFTTQSSGEMLSALATAVGARLERTGRVVLLRMRP
jgi:transmembrane sensor